MVLIWGLAEDNPTARVIEELRRCNVPIVWVDQQLTGEYHLEPDGRNDAAGVLRGPGGTVDLRDVRGAYLRPYDFRLLEAGRKLRPHDPRFEKWVAFEEALRAWAEATEATIMNRFSAMASNGSKPYQAEFIRQYGFSVPETLITSDPEAARAFWAVHGSVVYKSMSSQRSIVSRLTETEAERLGQVVRCLTQFQRWIPGIDYRAHVVGDQVFSCRICAAATDYRYDKEAQIDGVELPETIVEQCYRLTKALGLELSGVDLRQTPDGEWFCFEVNPSPGFSYYEATTDLPIGAAIARTLAYG